MPSFNLGTNRFPLHLAAFGLTGPIAFANSLASDLPAGGKNVVLLQGSDNDADAATPFLAGTAANLIAAKVVQDGAGFFVYFNAMLTLNRLVF